MLMGQAREGVFIYYNRGDGTFAESYVVQWPPSYGAAHLSVVDFDGDGDLDLLTARIGLSVSARYGIQAA